MGDVEKPLVPYQRLLSFPVFSISMPITKEPTSGLEPLT
jgi:hypothetical protein